MKLVILSLLCVYVGFELQRWQRPAVEDLEYAAAVAWNGGELAPAEQAARRAFGRSSEAAQAREILARLSEPLGRPEIKLATIMPDRNAPDLREQQWNEAGRFALSLDLFRIANDYFSRGVQQFPRSSALRRQYVSLSGLQLDAESMQERLWEWSQAGTPAAEIVVMFLGLASIDSRSAEAAEEWLRDSLTADANDLESRLGLARCLMAMGRCRECIQILEPSKSVPQAAILLAVAYATERNRAAAESLLPEAEPEEMRAEFWYARGLIAVEKSDWATAELAFKNAVLNRPLSKPYRSRYCEVLRRQNKIEEEARQVKELETVIRIVQSALDTKKATAPASMKELAEMCVLVGADDVAQIISRSVGQ
jgi:tetratricopeptide (TPR) repeat protein